MKKFFALLLLCGTAFVFAMPNPKAASYKTHEVSTRGTGNSVASSTAAKSAPVVYFIREISPEALVKVYKATGYKASGKVGVKVSTGESENSNYLRPALIKNYMLRVCLWQTREATAGCDQYSLRRRTEQQHRPHENCPRPRLS